MKIKLTLLLLLISSIAGAQSIHVNDAGTLREITGVFINDAGTLREIKEGWINDAGTLRQFYANLLVEVAAFNLHTTGCFSCQAICNIRVSSDGNIYNSDNAGAYGAAEELWLESGSAADVWFERVVTSGALDTDDTGAGRVNLSSGDYDLGVTAAADTTDSVGFTLNFYDAASAGNLLDSQAASCAADGTGI